jgi:hypothetical protein
MKILKQSFRSGAELLESLNPDPAPGSMFCPTTTPLEDGEQLLVEWIAPELPNAVVLRAKVRAWRPALPRRRIRAGATVDYPESEREKIEFVRATLGGERAPQAKRRFTRLPVELPVRYRASDVAELVQGGLTEISVGGGLLRTNDDHPLSVGAEVILELLPPGAVSPLAISGKVTYKPGLAVAGIKFACRDSGGSRRLREIVRRLTEA